MDNSDQPNSILHVNPLQMYPIPTSDTSVPTRFPLLCGEGVVHAGDSVYGALVLTNYRLFVQLCDTQHHVPLGLLESIEQRDLFYLHIGCKDARTYKLTFDNNEICLDWFGRLLKASAPPSHLEELFAFFFFVWSKQERSKQEMAAKLEMKRALLYDEKTFNGEVDRLQFNLHGTWRISSINKNYKLCGSYPPNLLVPAYITDEVLETVAKFRSSRRIPAVVWRHVGNGAVIARCSQPEVGWLGWRSAEDEDLIKAISEACTQDRGPNAMYDTHSPPSVNSSNEESTHIQADIKITEKKKVLIMDARSYTTAVANRARGGGCECPEYYPSCEIQFMNLANIHSIRKSFHALRALCASTVDQVNWFSLLEGTRWLQHMSGLMRAAVTLVTAVERDARPVLVHCSDGWDRTPQIVALAELLLDPYYRTVDGFRILIEREWLAFGHKFADRCGHATGSEDQNERCPVFLQWLDCVHQLIAQFPCAFEFSHTYLVKLAQHVYSNLFGTFLCNTKRERERVYETTFSVWLFLDTPTFRNHLYSPQMSDQVIWPQYSVRDLKVWSEVYLGSLEMQSGSSSSDGSNATISTPAPSESLTQHMTKTRSYGDLPQASGNGTLVRRCSDPNIIVDSIKMGSLKLEAEEALANGRSTTPTNGAVFLCEMDENDCKSDCIYKNVEDDLNEILDKEAAASLKGEASNGLDGSERSEHVIEKTDVEEEDKCVCGIGNELTNGHTNGDVLDGSSSCRKPNGDVSVSAGKASASRQCEDGGGGGLMYSVCLEKSGQAGDINHNGEVRGDDDPDSECTDPSDSRSENVTVLCDSLQRLAANSVETSTETLVSDNNICSSSKETNGFEKLPSPESCNGNGEVCRICAQNMKFIHGKHSHQHSGNTSGKTSRYSTPPLYSRTPSANGWEGSFLYCNNSPPKYHYNTALDDDGLIPLRSDVQERLRQIMDDNRRKVEALQRELHTYRQALIKQVCHKCNHNDGDKNDDTSSLSSCEVTSETLSSASPRSQSPEPCSIVESVCSAGEGQASAVESLRSDMSWEAVDDGPAALEGNPTLWVPDHAVSRCTGCRTEFWLGRRKHHCRNCGRIFCADCSENSTPLPSEQLYDPVRVCTTCYSKLRRQECGEVPELCKHSPQPAAGNGPHQITATSN